MLLITERAHHHHHGFVDRPVELSSTEPLTLALVKTYLRFTSSAEDDLLNGWIATARAVFEEQTGRQIIDATWEYASHHVPRRRSIDLPRPPLGGDVSITYDDANGDAQTFDPANYTVTTSFLASASSPGEPPIDPFCGPGRITLVTDADWPAVSGDPCCFRIRRTCGYGDSADEVPPIIKSVLYLMVAHFHRNRVEVDVNRGFEVLPLGARDLIRNFKYSGFPL